LTKTLLEQQAKPVYLVPCTVTQLSPLQVSLLGQDAVPGVGLGGLTYSLGAANALLTTPGKPIILPIGP
jgi:hypothetical protein